jgi:hypothetical protein
MVSNSILKGQIVEEILDNLRGKKVCVSYSGNISGQHYINEFDCCLSKNKKILLITDDDSDNEPCVLIDCKKIKTYSDDDLFGTITIELSGNMVIDIYEY